jgi:hypothetical protein
MDQYYAKRRLAKPTVKNVHYTYALVVLQEWAFLFVQVMALRHVPPKDHTVGEHWKYRR